MLVGLARQPAQGIGPLALITLLKGLEDEPGMLAVGRDECVSQLVSAVCDWNETRAIASRRLLQERKVARLCIRVAVVQVEIAVALPVHCRRARRLREAYCGDA
jgi:hypothetical protein